MRAVIVAAFDTCFDRVKLLKGYYIERGYDVVVVTSDFSHRKKSKYTNDFADMHIEVREYHKNLSVDRLRSHMEFSKKAYQLMDSLRPDLIHAFIPCNTLTKYMAKYKKSCSGVKLVFDIIDLWPETMPVQKVSWAFPFKIWRNYRDKYLKYGDVVFTECHLFQEYIHLGKTLYWARDQKPLCIDFSPCEDVLQFCYLGSINNIIDIDLIVNFLRNCTFKKKTCLHIIGVGERKEELIDACLNVGINVIDHKEVYSQEMKQEIFDQCHFAFNVMKPSVVVGLSMKSLDYMCGGIPILNTIGGDTWQFCEEWYIGYNLSHDNLNEIIDLVCEQSVDENLQMRKNIQNLYNTYFTKDSFYKSLDEVL